ncbi:phosphatase PAP2 family protein [Lysinibacillus sp. K60]
MSRIWIGVHYPLEVILGALIGIISAIIIYFTLSKLTLRERNYRLLEKLE